MTDTAVLLTGSFGSHVLKIDRTVATNARSVFLRARTKGLVQIEQEIEFVTCGKTGSSIVTLPAPTSPTVWNATAPGAPITLPTNALYKSIDVGASGTSANLDFPAWAIADNWKSCGVFFKYGI